MTGNDAERPRVDLPQGKVLGLTLTKDLPQPVEAFRGIPFALPPTGDRRFRPAVKVPASPDAVIDASQYGPSGPGKPLLASAVELEYSEDCLTVNVFRKPNGSQQPLPVAVYLHGGAFNRGTASMHDTASMVAWSQASFIAVSCNYRLGALGFLPSSITHKEGVLNLGLRDQIMVLEWVRDNIGKFGGDPGQVTLFGLSAGAHSIGHHLMNYNEGVPPLFHRVVIESGAPTSRAVRPYNAPIHEAQFRDFLREVECPKDCPDDEILSFLRAVPAEKLWAAQTAVFDKYNPSLRWAFQPVIDGDIIPRPPLQTWLEGKWHKVPIMTGFTRNEGSLYVNKTCATSAEFDTFFTDLLPLLEPSDIATMNKLYPDPLADPSSPYCETRDRVGAQYRRVEAAYANYAYVAPVRQTAEFASADNAVPVFLYQWALESSIANGAQHGDNMRYEVCSPNVIKISPTQKAIARTMNAYVSSFITTGDPNAIVVPGLDRPKWELYDSTAPTAMVFGLDNKELVGGEAKGPSSQVLPDTWEHKQSEFWWSKVEISQQ